MSLSLLEEYIENGDSIAIDDLLNGSPTLCSQKTSHEISPLLLACYYNKPQIVKVLLKHINELTIHEAAAANLLEQVQAMVENHPDALELISDHGYTPSRMLAHIGNENIDHYILSRASVLNSHSRHD